MQGMRYFISGMIKNKIRLSLQFLLLAHGLIIAQNELSLLHHFDDPIFQHASVAMTVLDYETGLTAFDFNGDQSLIPASSLKVVTTFSALELLGNEYKYKTRILHSGEILDDGTLVGNIVIKGSGDPSLGSPFFKDASNFKQVLQDVLDHIKGAGITCIYGAIQIEQNDFDQFPINPSWQWDDLGNYYAAGVWSFNIHENMYWVRFDRSQEPFMNTTISHVEPSVPNLRISNHVTTGEQGSGDNAYIYGNPFGTQIEIQGTIPPGKALFSIKGAIPQPHLFFKEYLEKTLALHGIKLYSNMDINAVNLPVPVIRIGELESPNLSTICRYANVRSNNLYCEAVLKTIGKELGEKGSTNSGIDVVFDFLSSSSLPVSGVTLKDGSGLSVRNRIPTNLLAQFLHKIARNNSRQHLKMHLPKASDKRGGENAFFRPLINGEIYLKSGSMDQVLAYCGLVELPERSYIFSFISNGHTCKNAIVKRKVESIIQSF